MHHHHIFAALPASGGLGAAVARALALGGEALAQAGYGPAVLGPISQGGVHVDEAVLGRVGAGLEGFFAQAAPRAATFAARLPRPVARLVLPVLPYDLYYPMLWRHLAARRALPAFDTLAPGLMVQGRGWAQLVPELIAAFKPQETVLLPAPVSAAQVLGALVPLAALPDPQPLTQTSLPDTALAMLQRLYKMGVNISPRQATRLAEVHARQPQPAPLASFSPLEAAALRRRFSREMEQLSRLPGVRIGSGLELACAAE